MLLLSFIIIYYRHGYALSFSVFLFENSMNGYVFSFFDFIPSLYDWAIIRFLIVDCNWYLSYISFASFPLSIYHFVLSCENFYKNIRNFNIRYIYLYYCLNERNKKFWLRLSTNKRDFAEFKWINRMNNRKKN